MRGIHLKQIDSEGRELPEYREGAFHIPVRDTDPLFENELLFPDSIPDLARRVRLQLEKTLELLNEALARGSPHPDKDKP